MFVSGINICRSPSTISLGLLGAFGLQGVLIVMRSAMLTVAGERMAANMRKDLFRAILSQDIAWFDSHRTGELVNRLRYFTFDDFYSCDYLIVNFLFFYQRGHECGAKSLDE